MLMRVCVCAAMENQAADPEVQQFLMMEQQKAQFQSQVHRMVDTCWDRCIDKPRDKLDSRAETCLSNCVERFFDTSIYITGRFLYLEAVDSATGPAVNVSDNQWLWL